MASACLAIVDPEGTAERQQEAEERETEREAEREAEAEREEEEEAERQAEEDRLAEEEAEREAEEEAQRQAEEEAEAERRAEEERMEGMVEIPDVSGMLAGEARDELIELGLSAEYEADEGSVWDSSNWQAASTSPAAGELTEDDSEVVIHVVRSEEYEEDRAERQAEREARFDIEHDSDDLGGMIPGGTTFVRFDIADNFTQGMIASRAERDTCEALELGLNEHPDTGRIAVEGSFPTTDAYGNEDESVILRAHYDRGTLGQINFDNCQIIDVWGIRDGGQLHPDLQE